MPKKYYAHPAFGEIALKKNLLSKGLRIIIRSSNSITVTFPYHLTYNDAIRFVNEKEGWIKDNLKRIRTLVPAKKAFLPGNAFKTFAHELLFDQLEQGNPYIKVDREKITVHYTDEEMLSSNEVQEHIQKAIDKVLRIEALKYLPSRVDFFAEKFGLNYKGISVKNMRTRWGSCSTTGKLNFNIHLMRLPVHLIDYVILHELAHLKHHNHGPNFWKYLDELAGNNSKMLSLEMKKFRTTVY
jgi:predicted metal-dependent hydrolase